MKLTGLEDGLWCGRGREEKMGVFPMLWKVTATSVLVVCHPNMYEAGAGGASVVQGHPQLCRNVLAGLA